VRREVKNFPREQSLYLTAFVLEDTTQVDEELRYKDRSIHDGCTYGSSHQSEEAQGTQKNLQYVSLIVQYY
jgi:hypothetical protein